MPKNYRSIALYVIGIADNPVVLFENRKTTDFTESGPLTQKRLRVCLNFEIRDGKTPIIGFHDHPNEMWIAEGFEEVAEHCQSQGWLKIQRGASW